MISSDRVRDDGSSIESAFFYDIQLGLHGGGAAQISDALIEVAATKLANFIGRSRDDVANCDFALVDEDAIWTTSGQAMYARTYCMNFRVVFESAAESNAARRTLDLAVTGSDDPTTGEFTDGANSIFIQDVMSAVAETGRFEWISPMPIRDGIAFLPVENNCSAHGKSIADTVRAHALPDGDYCLLSYYGWGYYLYREPSESDCYVTNTSDFANVSTSNYTIVYLTSTSEAPPPPVASSQDDKATIVFYIVSGISGCLLLVTTVAVLFYRQKFHIQKQNASHFRRVGSKLKRELDTRSADMSMLISAWHVSESELEIIRPLGRGSFGIVWQGRYRSKIDVAVKFMTALKDGPGALTRKNTESSEEEIHGSGSLAKRHFEQGEVRFLMRTRNQHIVLFLGCGVKNDRPFILTEFCEGGSLDSFLWEDRRAASSDPDAKFLTVVERVHCLLDVALGLRFLHAVHKSIHRDIKSPNVLMVKRSNGEYRKTTWKAKIADFGLSQLVLRGKRRLKKEQSGSVCLRDKHEKQVMWQKNFGRGFAGTVQWMAPEIMKGTSVYGPEIDIYSFGILMWEALGQKRPWASLSHDIRKLKKTVIDGGRPRIPDLKSEGVVVPNDLLPLMRACQAQRPAARPTILEVTKRLFVMVDPGSEEGGAWSQVLSESVSAATKDCESESRIICSSSESELGSPNSGQSMHDTDVSDVSSTESIPSVEMTSIAVGDATGAADIDIVEEDDLQDPPSSFLASIFGLYR
eukprot:g1212.t1